MRERTVETEVICEFFEHEVTLMVGEKCDRETEIRVHERLVRFFTVHVIQCEQWGPLCIYHRGDLIYGPRINHFLEYADWLIDD